jgi:outer membrane protein OmpA-like peptidoglycan-associated protein/tetratricopeptide (TPR) repeat protein
MRVAFLLILTFMGSCATAQKGNRKKAETEFISAFKAYSEGNKPAAMQFIKKALKADITFGNAWSLQAEIAEKSNDTALARTSYEACIKYEPRFQNHYYYYAKYCFRHGQYEKAIDLLAKFNNAPNESGFDPAKDKASATIKTQANKLGESCRLAMEDQQKVEDLEIRNLGPGVNSANYEYWPGMTVDGETLIFTRLVNGQEDFYVSSRLQDSWINARPLPGNINTSNNEGYTSVSADGRYIFFSVCNQDGYGSCDIFYSFLKGNAWSRRMNLGERINSAAWDAQPAISADGKTLIFSSARPGGMGGKDLWISRWKNGSWTIPENLGKTINTADDEEAPYLHYDGKTLYFSSSGHTGYGQHDIFRSQMLGGGEWTNPENMGRGINSDADEAGFYVDFKGERAYIASSREGGFGGLDIYSLKLSKDKKPNPVTYVKGTILDFDTKNEISGRIELINLGTGKSVLSDSSTRFFTTLEPHGMYGLNVYRNGYLFYSANFQPTLSTLDSPFLVTALLKPIKIDQSVVLNNIFFETDKFDLRPESYPELQKLYTLLKNNPDVLVEISGHTDNQGSEAHNTLLSDKRAKSVKEYLVKAGIPANSIKTAGYAASKPIGDNNTAFGRAQNRRIEMKIIGLIKQ